MFGSTEYTPTGWVAVYEPRPGMREVLPVESWDTDGNALIVHPVQGKLIPVHDHPHFKILDRWNALSPRCRPRLDGAPDSHHPAEVSRGWNRSLLG